MKFFLLFLLLICVSAKPLYDPGEKHEAVMRMLEFCKHVNCSIHHSNGQIAKTWRNAQLLTCCPSFRRRYNYQYFND